MVDFSSDQEVKAWLETRTREEIVAMAARAAGRMFPRLVDSVTWSTDNLDLRIARAIMTAGLNSVSTSAAIKNAAMCSASVLVKSKTSSSFSDADFKVNVMVASSVSPIASYVADQAATTAHATSDAAPVFAANAISGATLNGYVDVPAALEAYALDFATLEGGDVGTVMAHSLWVNKQPTKMAQRWQEIKKVRSVDRQTWGFWIDWYEGLLEGRPIDWELWRDIALLPNEIWEEGPEAVALAIEEIKAQRLPSLSDAQVTA